MPTPTRLIGQDCTILFVDGGPFVVGTTVTFAAAITVTAFAKSIKVGNKVNLVDMRGLGDTYKKNRPTYGEGSVTLELLIESTGAVVTTAGNVAKIVYNPLTGLTAATLSGIVASNDFDAALDNPQMQTITLDAGYDDV